MLWRKSFWLNKCEFWPLKLNIIISYWEVVTHILIFSGRHDLRSDASQSIFFFCLFKKYKVLHCHWFTVLGCLISPKCLLDLHNSKRFSCVHECDFFLQGFVTLGPARYSFQQDSDLQSQITKKWIGMRGFTQSFQSQLLFMVSWRVRFFSNLGEHRSAVSNLCSARRANSCGERFSFLEDNEKFVFQYCGPLW